MKTIIGTIWVASDGTEFLSEERCKSHEDDTLSKEFDQRLDATLTFNDDLNCTAILCFEQFKSFCENNRDWVLQNALGTDLLNIDKINYE